MMVAVHAHSLGRTSLVAAVLVASGVPAVRAGRVDPSVALRHE
jgi:ABC-type lipoprotein release transport system permease subunit